jgi:hypothetical protein
MKSRPRIDRGATQYGEQALLLAMGPWSYTAEVMTASN